MSFFERILAPVIAGLVTVGMASIVAWLTHVPFERAALIVIMIRVGIIDWSMTRRSS